MSNSSSLNDRERADLVAYLDGELTGEAARAMERKLSIDPFARAEAEALRRTWDLLDYLPKAEPSASFTQKTMSKLTPMPPTLSPVRVARYRRWRLAVLVAGWAAALLVASVIGYKGSQFFLHRKAGEKDLVRDLHLIENKRFYDLVDDIKDLRKLDDPDLFGTETTEP